MVGPVLGVTSYQLLGDATTSRQSWRTSLMLVLLPHPFTRVPVWGYGRLLNSHNGHIPSASAQCCLSFVVMFAWVVERRRVTPKTSCFQSDL